jgi:hypothetical protein
LFSIESGGKIRLIDLINFLNANEQFQVSAYGDKPITKKIIKRVAQLIHAQVLLLEIVEKFREYLKRDLYGTDRVVSAFHTIDSERIYFINPTK